MWIAFMLLCTGPSALTCEVMAKTESTFVTEEACIQEALVVARYFQSQGYLAIPECKKIKVGLGV
jgi:hypothetical protein|tara:strand:- start:926 stop:1120 length:195 start_codon:yes stop_codon:yes gene_type:complete